MIDRVPELLAETRLAGLFEEVEFPLSREELIEFAEERRVPGNVVDALGRLPDRVFYSIGEVYECWPEPKEGD